METQTHQDEARGFIRRHPFLTAGAAALLLVAVVASQFTGNKPEASTASFPVKRGDLLISVVEGGNLEAVSEISIRNMVEGTARIIRLASEGSYVKKGDLLVELDSSSAQDQVNQQEITVRKSELELLQAEKQLQITRSQTNSDITAAKIALELANIDLNKFTQGELAQKERELELEVDTIKEQLTIDEERYRFSTNLLAAGFETKAKADADRLTWLRTQKNLQQATNGLWMFQEFDRKKLLTEYESKVEEAEKELSRVNDQSEAQMAQFTADLETKKKTLLLNEDKLKRDLANLEACKIYAPSDGLVVFPVGESRFSQESMIEEGATVRYRQELIKLPDTSSMKLTIKVHETHVGKVKPGQRAYVVLDPLPDRQFLGTVTKVGLLPNNQDRWSNPNLKVYDTEILISEQLPETVKPGVSARAEVIVTNLTDVLTVPVQAVTTLKGKPVVYLAGSTPRAVSVEVGQFNTKFIQIQSGVSAGDLVLLTPPFDSEAVNLDGAILVENETLATNSLAVAPTAPAARGAAAPSLPEAGRNAPDGAAPAGPSSRGGDRGAPGFDREAMMKQFDKNGDGQLTGEELQAMQAQLQARFGGQRGGMSREEMLKRYDKDGDGELNEAEQAARREEFARQRGTGEGGRRGNLGEGASEPGPGRGEPAQGNTRSARPDQGTER